jgi:hypothetical protein
MEEGIEMDNIFTEEDFVYIQKAIDNQHQANLVLLERLKDSGANREDLQLLTDIVSEDFSRSGLNGEDEPDDYGLKLEAIIDKLNG